MATMEAELEQCQSLVSQMLETRPEKYSSSPVIRDFKLCLDALRLTLWALLQSQDEGHWEGRRAVVDLPGKLVEFRVKRLIQMLGDLRQDIEDGRLAGTSDDVAGLSKALRSAVEQVERYTA